MKYRVKKTFKTTDKDGNVISGTKGKVIETTKKSVSHLPDDYLEEAKKKS